MVSLKTVQSVESMLKAGAFIISIAVIFCVMNLLKGIVFIGRKLFKS